MSRHNGIVINRKWKTITHRGVTWRPMADRALAFHAMTMMILGNGVSRRQLFSHVYGHRPDGGPLHGPKVFDVHFNHWKPVFAMLQLELHRVKVAGEMLFSLAPTMQVAHADVA